MPSLDEHQSSTVTKMIFLGDSGAGKTGALASLANAGYQLRILDLDNGLDVLANLLRDPKGGYGASAIKNVKFVTLTEPMRNVNGKLIPKASRVWQRAMELLNNWEDGADKLGPISTWGERDVLVIDSLTLLGNAAMNFILSMNGRIGQQPHQSDWYQGQQMIEALLQMLYDENIKCNVIVISHITYIGDDNGPQRGYPAAPGKALSPKIGRYFNSMLMLRSSGSGASVQRKLLTNSTVMVELKNSAPTKVKAEYPIATGLADYFHDVRSAAPAVKPATATPPPTPSPASPESPTPAPSKL